MKQLLFLLLFGSCCLLWAQTNTPGPDAAEQEIGVRSGQFYFDGNARQVVYYDHVVVTNLQGKLTCERLTINLAPEGATNQHPTLAVAETNVVVFFINKNETNHITSDKAIYAFSVVNAVTNQTLTFTGHARAENSKARMAGDLLIWDMIANRFTGPGAETHIKIPTNTGDGTNAMPKLF